MKIGTKSVLFGVHQFAIHPLTVLLAWRKLYRRWPNWWELIAIVLHDTPGYYGCADIDGVEGKHHPERGAHWAAYISGAICYHVGRHDWDLFFFTACHSRDWAAIHRTPVSPLYCADKFSIFYDPEWCYLLRARLSGELTEFKTRAIASGELPAGATDRQWLHFYKQNVLSRPEIAQLLNK